VENFHNVILKYFWYYIRDALKYQEKNTSSGEKIVKFTLKLMLVVCLFSSIALAEEGNMGSGGRSCPTPAPCRPDTQPTDRTDKDMETADSILDIVRGYLFSMFG